MRPLPLVVSLNTSSSISAPERKKLFSISSLGREEGRMGGGGDGRKGG